MVKTHIITTGKETILVVDLPEGAESIHISEFYENKLSYKTSTSLHFIETSLPMGKWRLLGQPDEISEEVAENIVDACWYVGWKDYGSKDKSICRGLCEATESLHSLIASEVCLVNPLGEKPPKAVCMIGGMELLVRGSMTYELNAQRLAKWREAEYKVFKNPIILIDKN